MNDEFDARLRTRLDRLAAAVPSRTFADIPHARTTARLSSGRSLVAGIVVVVLLVASFAFLGGGTRDGRISATRSDGSFSLTVWAGRAHYTANEPIDAGATFEYIGDDSSITVWSYGSGPLGFGVREVGGDRAVGPAYRMSCARFDYERTEPMDQAFTKSGGTGGGSSPQVAEFIATYLDVEGDPPDRSLRLPVGTWQLFVEAHYSTKGCGDDQRLESSVTVVVDPAAPAATGMPTSRPASDTPATTVPGPPSSVTLPPPSVALPYPEGCAAYGLSPRRCTYIVEGVAKQAGAEVDTSRIELLGDPDCRSNDPYACGVLRSTAFVVRVRITPTSGTSTERSVFCGVFGEYSLTCSDDPRIMTGSPTMSGYHDVPCTEEGPIGCATALPTISSAAASDAEALEVMSLDIPVDHVGTYSIPVGRAVLPNGILSDASFRLADDSPADLVISPDGGVFLHVSDAQNGEELFNYYDHGWRSGVEEVEARLTFTVESFDPGAVLTVRDLVVR